MTAAMTWWRLRWPTRKVWRLWTWPTTPSTCAPPASFRPPRCVRGPGPQPARSFFGAFSRRTAVSAGFRVCARMAAPRRSALHGCLHNVAAVSHVDPTHPGWRAMHSTHSGCSAAFMPEALQSFSFFFFFFFACVISPACLGAGNGPVGADGHPYGAAAALRRDPPRARSAQSETLLPHLFPKLCSTHRFTGQSENPHSVAIQTHSPKGMETHGTVGACD